MLQFMACSVRLLDMNKLPIEASTYLIEGLTKWSVEELIKPFDMMLQKECVKHLSIGVSMGGDLLSTSLKIKSIVKLANTPYHYLCTSGAFNVPTANVNYCLNCDSPDHVFGSFPHKKFQKKISENKRKFIDMNQSKGWSGGGKTWAKNSNKKGRTNKYHKKQQINKKSNWNGNTKSNNGVQLVYRNCMWLCSKGCGFDISHTTWLHDTWASCVQNNQSLTFTATHVFQNKMAPASITVPQVASNNGGVTQDPLPINVGTAPAPSPAPVGVLHHIGSVVLASQYKVNIKIMLFLILNYIH